MLSRAVGVEVHLHHAPVAVAEAARHALFHRDLGERLFAPGERVHGAREAIGPADGEGVEVELLG